MASAGAIVIMLGYIQQRNPTLFVVIAIPIIVVLLCLLVYVVKETREVGKFNGK